jgi:hypothetical protein
MADKPHVINTSAAGTLERRSESPRYERVTRFRVVLPDASFSA